MTPTIIPPGYKSRIVGSDADNSLPSLRWDLFYEGEAVPLLSFSTGEVVVIYVQMMHNESSKGPVVSVTGMGLFELRV
jgi:hypothetical protein